MARFFHTGAGAVERDEAYLPWRGPASRGLIVSSVQFLIGKTLGKYEVLEHIGHGGMSEVYKGQQAQLDRMVAIKVLHPFLADEKGFVVRFQREARIVATLRHPNIVQVYDFDYHDELGIYYMVMEYIDGLTLKDRLEEGPRSPEETILVGTAIADALDYAHQRGMVHRDIKPANIMFINDDEPVLADFGIAKMVTLSGLTASGAMVGTPAYMAPEIGIGKAGTASSDIYSLSVVLYQMVTGSLPFEAETPMAMVMDHINKAPPPPSLFASGIPEELEQAILRGLEKEPEARFRTGREMAQALRKVWEPASGARFASAPVSPAHIDEVFELGREMVKIPAPTGAIDGSDGGSAISASRAEVAVGGANGAQTNKEAVASQAIASGEGIDVGAGQSETAVGVQPRVRWPRRLLRSTLLILLLAAVGTGIWASLDNEMERKIPDLANRLLARTISGTESPPGDAGNPLPARIEPSPETPTPTLTPPPSATTSRMEALPLAPAPTATPTAPCSYRARLDQIKLEPDKIVAPETSLVAYVSLWNSGKCSWPEGVNLVFVNGDPLGAPDSFAIKALGLNQSIQVVIPMRAPEELGTYHSTWELQRSDGEALGPRIEIEVSVEDVPPLTPTPAEPVVLDSATPEPLTMRKPTLITWKEDPANNRWSGVLGFQAEGGSGYYRYYLDKIGEPSELSDGRLSFEAQRCSPVRANVWVLSGDQTLNWQGEIPYPAEDDCP
ncbi:MAG: protein kinase domain-containing protein [Anaerolineae bacterium]